jgi:predicted transcriptional regulator
MDTAGFDLELGRRIRTLMEERELTLSDAADRTGIPFSTLWRHLNRGGLTAREVHALAGLLDTSVAALAEMAAA